MLKVLMIGGMRCPTCAADPATDQAKQGPTLVNLKCPKCGKVAQLARWLVVEEIRVPLPDERT